MTATALNNSNIQMHRPLPRMRIAKDCHKTIQVVEFHSPIFASWQMKTKFRSHWVGKRCLINYDALLDYLAHPTNVQHPLPTGYGTIRPVPERLR